MGDKCSKCDGSGLIPFWNKEGKLIPHAYVYCECNEFFQTEHYHQVRPEDFDFPISYSYYRMLCNEHGWPDPGSDELSEEPEKREALPLFRPRPVDAEIDQLKAQVNYLTNKVTELKAKKKQEEYY